jgi:hypothetical protein
MKVDLSKFRRTNENKTKRNSNFILAKFLLAPLSGKVEQKCLVPARFGCLKEIERNHQESRFFSQNEQ